MTRHILLSTLVLLGLRTIASGQNVVLSVVPGSGTAGGTVTVPITLASTGGAQTTGLQWAFNYSSDITGVTVVAGASTTNAGKSVSCSGNNCLVAGFNSTVIADGTVASATFQIAANPSSNPIQIQLTGVVATTAGGASIPSAGGSGTIMLPVAAVGLSSLTCISSTINTPGSTSCSVALTGAASGGGFVVSLASNNPSFTVPSSVTIASGQTSSVFTATGAQVGINQTGTVTASVGGANLTSTLSLMAPAQLNGLACAPSTLSSNTSSTCTVTLNKPATSAATVTLASYNGLLAVPASVTVATGQNSATFTATAGTVSSSQGAIVAATLNGQGQQATISLAASAQLSSLSCSPSTVNAPGAANCTVTLNAAASSLVGVTLSSNNANVTVPASINIGAGLNSATFTAAVAAVTSNQGALLTASLNGGSQSFTLSATAPAQLSTLSCATSTLSSNASSTCTVTLNAAATSPAFVTLASNNGLLTVPAGVTVATGQSTATFTATSGTVNSSQNALVTATLSGQSQQTTISLAAAAQLSALTCSPSTVVAPGTTTCTATLTAAASSAASVTLLSNNSNLTVPASITVIAGQASASFTATAALQVNAAQSATITAGLGISTTSSVLSLAQPKAAAATSSANVMPPDTFTQGNWKGVYGADGYIIANDFSSAPAYLSVPPAGLFTGANSYTWVPSSPEPRALRKATSATDRIASTFYAGASYSVDLPFTDGQLHQVALYMLDLDTFERSETITILDRATNAILSTQSFANFHMGTWAIWNIQGPVRVQVSRTAGMNAVVSGLFFNTLSSGAAPSAAPPTVSINAPFANQQISGTQVLSASAAAATTPGSSIVSVQFQLDGNNLGPAVTSGPPYTFSWASGTTSNGPHSLVAVATDNFGQSTSSAAVAVTVNNQLTTSAVFVNKDVTTQGSWKGHYGADGAMIARDSVHLPAYAAANLLGGQPFQWTLTGDQRALQMSNSASLRVASTYYDNPGFSLDLNLADGNTHQVALYFMDWDGGGRAETVTILDASTQAVLDAPRLVSNFGGGQYLVWNVKGHVTIQFSRISGANALLNGVFLAPVAP